MVRTTTYESAGTVGTVESAVGVEPAATRALRRVSWGAVFAGVVIALITQFLLSMLGVGIGVSTIDPLTGDTPGVTAFSISAAIWWTVGGIIAAFAGGWVAGRLSGTPSPVSASLHGLVTWATSMLVVFYLLTSAVGSLIGGAFGVVGSALSQAGAAVGAAAPQLASAASGPMGDMMREVQDSLRNGSAADKAQAVAAITRVVTNGTNASQPDREQATNAIAQQGGISQDEARARLTQWTETYQRNAAEAKTKAREAAEKTASVVSRAAIFGFIALVLGAVAGAFGGRAGRSTAMATAIVD